ncbi:hypothetical protein HMPREF3155_11195 [Corynebacterium sp. HMSC06D04]|uniref:hypothetical protein n=1 Tax=unclassified Corynebacterium TaxID=2624378 RepID=UPI0008A287E1|nr:MULTISPECIES: hypothetical protein [unclassified Corynebacterium]OFT47218.1 hypothetical protein HMPREF3158_04500 [Corynebacterium sp. HMSC06G04]OFT49613.1 hypothetical protein HMPREF3155_11195 [Corynebacterium sp. HMSC06D04]OHO66272.1 hypothetical protein HMPREF2692_09245 [Corynebacterium sp. HMSC036D03]
MRKLALVVALSSSLLLAPQASAEQTCDPTQTCAEPAPQQTSSFAEAWNYILGLTALGGMFAIIGHAIMKSGLLPAMPALPSI